MLVGEQTGTEPICGVRLPSNLYPQRLTSTALARSASPSSIRPGKATGLLHYKLAVNPGPCFHSPVAILQYLSGISAHVI
ncbi:hypothetical protein CesoFtcFv8_002478 [Champsocephalus esox]|uniref:Uncharacterized protein n=1 Tax=Champsocephalus esox TaxID=159716 RepID=A0AAN8HHL8_9TELE|nr:hypothetical protein CesoFtcFv8_002478 [Champsocephalus esox]